MISLENAVVARLESFGERFEILVDPNLAARVRQGENLNIEDVVAALNVFGNASSKVACLVCSEVIATPSGSRVEVAEGCKVIKVL